MNLYSIASVVLLLLVQLINDAYALRCYTCIPILQSGEDCGSPTSDQMITCDVTQDICRVTAVSLPGTNGVRTPTINRGCGTSSDFSGSQSGFLQTGAQRCTTFSEGQRVSKLCQCNYDGCNALTMGQLSDNTMYGRGSSFGASTSLMALSSALVLLTLSMVLA